MDNTLFNVLLANPTIPVDGWENLARKWSSLNTGAGGNRDFSPLTVKGLYATGIMLACCRSVSILLDSKSGIDTTYYPAYTIFASAIDILGRCVRGNTGAHETKKDITAGFQWLAAPSVNQYERIPSDHVLVRTANYDYSINALIYLRHYAAHGQAYNRNEALEFDYLVLGEMPPLLANGMECYWNQLHSSEDLCNRLAKAAITPYRNRPIFDIAWSGVNAAESLLVSTIGEVFRGFDWRYKNRLLDQLLSASAID